MRVLLLDWRGTLDRRPNPGAFIDQLRAAGWYVILWSGSSIPANVSERADRVISKGTAFREVFEGLNPVEVVVCDDEPWYLGFVRDLGHRLIGPDDLDGLLGGP